MSRADGTCVSASLVQLHCDAPVSVATEYKENTWTALRTRKKGESGKRFCASPLQPEIHERGSPKEKQPHAEEI